MRSRLRLVLAFIVFTLLSIPASIHLYSVWLACAIARKPAARRRLGGLWRGWWADQSVKAMFFCLGVDSSFELPSIPESARHRPFLVISNHRKSLDILILAALMRRLGRPCTRWVLKKQLRHRALYIGHSCIMTECAFVGRDGDARDIADIVRSARVAREDGASVVLFPEGTRFTGRKRRGGYAQVLPPKYGGFLALKDVLPDYPVLSVTLHWEDKEGHTMFDSHTIVGMRLRVACELHDPAVSAREAWLEMEWRRKDQELVAAHPS